MSSKMIKEPENVFVQMSRIIMYGKWMEMPLNAVDGSFLSSFKWVVLLWMENEMEMTLSAVDGRFFLLVVNDIEKNYGIVEM